MGYTAEIPYGRYWSTPFAKWQGTLQHLHSLRLTAEVARERFAHWSLSPDVLDFAVFGQTVPQPQSFFGTPWFAGLIGASGVSGPTISQACATGVRCILTAAEAVDRGAATVSLAASGDRCSNGPHLYYPAPRGPGGTGAHEDWVLDNFGCDPLGGHSMLQTAENVASKHQISAAEQHEVVLRRYEQYAQALADDHAFQRRYMTLPMSVPDPGFKKQVSTMEGDEGVFATTAEGLARLRPVLKEGSVTFGGQTHPADGNAGIMIASSERARELSADPSMRIGLLGFGQSRVALAHMPEAPVEAARRALEEAGLGIGDMDAIKSHNPFAVNDIYFARQTGADIATMNNFGCSLIWGHPQGPTGLRGVIELIEELALRGGGYGLFQGCAAGDTAMAVVLRVGDATPERRARIQ